MAETDCLNILAVDEDEAVRDLLVTLLERAGHRATAVASANDASVHLERSVTDVIICDADLPGQGAFQLLAQMQVHRRTAAVIMTTTSDQVETAVRALRLGAYDVITKPFDADRVIDGVSRAAEQRRRDVERAASEAADRRGVPSPRTRVRIKVCGITNVADALAGAEAGADAVGLNFAVGPRRIDVETGREIVAALPPFLTPVGLFVDADPETIHDTCQACGLSAVQLHGDEAPDLVAMLAPLRVIKAFRVATRADVDAISAYLDDCPEGARPTAILLDARVPGLVGGTGRTIDWNLAAEARDLGLIVLAGGLGPENVAEAVRIARPYGVDACSRLETEPGRKDHGRLAAFVAAVRQAEAI